MIIGYAPIYLIVESVIVSFELILQPFYYVLNIFRIAYFIVKRKARFITLMYWIIFGYFYMFKRLAIDIKFNFNYLVLVKKDKSEKDELEDKPISNTAYSVLASVIFELFKQG